MDYLTFVNLCWAVVVMAAVLINFKKGYAKGVIDSHESITIPMIDHLIKNNYLNAKYSNDNPIESRELAAYLVREITKNGR